jgi:hypothetical protein
LLEVEEPKLPPESEELLSAVAAAIRRLGQTPGSEEAEKQARLYANHLIDRRLRLKDPNVGLFEKLRRSLDTKKAAELKQLEAEDPPTDARAFEKRHELAREKTTQNEIADFKQAAEKLLTATLALHAPARRALGLTDTLSARPGFALEEYLKDLIARSERSDVPELPKNAGRGRREVADEAKFTRELGKVFLLYTGNKPTIRTRDSEVYGPFYEFVKDIFRILQISASPETRARAAVKDMEFYTGEVPD